MQATLLEKGLLKGNANLYQLEKPIEYDGGTTKYLIVSRAHTMDRGDETMVFPADEVGNVLDWGELACGYGETHEDVLYQLDITVL